MLKLVTQPFLKFCNFLTIESTFIDYVLKLLLIFIHFFVLIVYENCRYRLIMVEITML